MHNIFITLEIKPIQSSPAGPERVEIAFRRPGNHSKVGNTARLRAISGPDQADQVRKPDSKPAGHGKNGKLGVGSHESGCSVLPVVTDEGFVPATTLGHSSTGHSL